MNQIFFTFAIIAIILSAQIDARPSIDDSKVELKEDDMEVAETHYGRKWGKDYWQQYQPVAIQKQQPVYTHQVVQQQQPVHQVVQQSQPVYTHQVVQQSQPVYTHQVVQQQEPIHQIVQQQQQPIYTQVVQQQQQPVYTHSVVQQPQTVYTHQVVQQQQPVQVEYDVVPVYVTNGVDNNKHSKYHG